MKKVWIIKEKIIIVFVVILVACMISPNMIIHAETEKNIYYMGETQKKNDAGYKKDVEMKSSDFHNGWRLGQFCISGWTRRTTDDNGNPVFLKNVGDEISVSFLLNQNIDKLNNKSNLQISEDKNGYDEYFGITKAEKTNFGRGTLLIKMKNYQNKETIQAPYTNYLEGVKKGANIKINTFEEGDYEIALDYEIRNNRFHIKKWDPINTYSHYQILIKFSVRNGNCMVYPFDVNTGSELTNCSFTENGFYLDLANSRYLDIDVKKENYVEENRTLIEDTRFNRPAKDGEEFTDPGIYTIMVSNQYTKSNTEKKIYVGTDPILKAYVTTGEDIDQIKKLLSEGAVIEDDGTITLASKEVIEGTEPTTEMVETMTNGKAQNRKKVEVMQENRTNIFSVIGVIIAAVILVLFIIVKRKKHKIKEKDSAEEKE